MSIHRLCLREFPCAVQYLDSRAIAPHDVVPARHGRKATGNFPIATAELNGDCAVSALLRRTDWSHRSIADRASIVSAVATKLRERKDEFASYITLEMGKLVGSARTEVELSAAILDYYAKHGELS